MSFHLLFSDIFGGYFCHEWREHLLAAFEGISEYLIPTYFTPFTIQCPMQQARQTVTNGSNMKNSNAQNFSQFKKECDTGSEARWFEGAAIVAGGHHLGRAIVGSPCSRNNRGISPSPSPWQTKQTGFETFFSGRTNEFGMIPTRKSFRNQRLEVVRRLPALALLNLEPSCIPSQVNKVSTSTGQVAPRQVAFTSKASRRPRDL